MRAAPAPRRGERMSKRLLLLSNSTMHGRDFIDHAAEEIKDFLGDVERLLFVPFALHDRDEYANKVRARFAGLGIEVDSLHDVDDEEAVENALAIFIGGGNTFRLLSSLYELKLIEPIRRRVEGGMPYIGSSAGTNCRTRISSRERRPAPNAAR